MFRCAQHDGCSGSSQRSERQTKCSQTSVSSAYRFFVALLLRMTNYSLFANSAADWNMQLAATWVGKEKRCLGRPRLAEINTGFSRASRSPALRRLAKLAPLASAREHLRHRSTASDKKPVPVSLPNQNRKLAAACATLRIAKPQKNSDQTTANEQRFLINPPAPLRRQRTAESTQTTLVQAVACTTPGVKLPFQR